MTISCCVTHPLAGADGGGAEGLDSGAQGCVGGDDRQRRRVTVALDFFDDAIVGLLLLSYRSGPIP